ncbi:4573_t:CDS:1 [Scutellospora calospora]|uniref:4573_t:CDS:1 n=1 Tax=Scutellospora calospora TaxID=85575 RepID=A0ACA9K176_9GLOM|nr:4573_t:CDS:1 [Scutellospora calospora]
MDSTYTLVSLIFLETYSEIYLLAKEFNQLKMFYQTNNDYELEFKEALNKKESSLENIEYNNIHKIQESNNQILTPLQIENFQKIFAQHTIKESDDEQETDEKVIVLLDQQEKEAFFVKLRTSVCCETKMCLAKIDYELAFQIFDNIRKLSKTEHNMFLLGMLHAMTCSKDTTSRGKEKQYLTIKYTFDNNEICEIAFRTIYSLSEKK